MCSGIMIHRMPQGVVIRFGPIVFRISSSLSYSIVVQVGQDAVPWQVGMAIARSQHPPRSDWPSTVQLLSRALFGTASAGEIDALFDEKGYFWRDQSLWLPKDLLHQLLSLADGQLSVRWQQAILESKLDLTLSSEMQMAAKENLVEGLKGLKTKDQICVTGALRDELLRIYDQLCPSFSFLPSVGEVRLSTRVASLFHIIFVLDKSGSMQMEDVQPEDPAIQVDCNNRYGAVVEAMISFASHRSRLVDGDRATVITYDTTVCHCSPSILFLVRTEPLDAPLRVLLVVARGWLCRTMLLLGLH